MIDAEGEKKEWQAYYGFNKLKPKEIAGSKYNEADIRRKAPTFDEAIAKADQAKIDKQNATIKSKIGDYLREIDTRASFYQFNHSDSAEITALKNNSAVLVGIVKTAQGNGSLADNKEFRDALLESIL